MNLFKVFLGSSNFKSPVGAKPPEGRDYMYPCVWSPLPHVSIWHITGTQSVFVVK